MAVVVSEVVEIPSPGARVRAEVVRPKGERRVPVVLAWTDVFMLTPPHRRMARRLAGHGYCVVTPEIYARFEPAGTLLDFEADRERALSDMAKLEPAWIDEDRRAVLEWALRQPGVDASRLATCGWCFGGHLALRAAIEPEVKAAACFYATGLHEANLGAAKGTADTLARAKEIRGEVLMVWGSEDPHIPREGRGKVHGALEAAGTRFSFRVYDAAHAFMRDEGPRHDPEATDAAFAEMLALFSRALRS